MKVISKTLKVIAFTLAAILSLFVLYVAFDAIIGAILVGQNVDYYKSVEAVKPDSEILKPIESEDGITTFVTDGKFKILMLSDTHIGGGVLSGDEDAFALRAIEKLVRAEKPDLVALTGDIVYTTAWQTGNTDNKKPMQMVANLFESLKVYWAPIFGNHDSENAKYTRKEIGEYLENGGLKYSLFKSGRADIDGVGNYLINIESTAGEITQTIFFMDSHAYPEAPDEKYEYDNVHTNQIEWYERELLAQNEKNTNKGFDKPKSILFVHIPFEEYVDAYEHGDIVYGELRERICYGVNYGFFDKIKELGQTKAVFCGHDHTNDFAVEYEGITLYYGMSIDYLAYIYTKFYNPARGGTRVVVENGGYTAERVFLKDIKD